jgi:hypothetical protein
MAGFLHSQTKTQKQSQTKDTRRQRYLYCEPPAPGWIAEIRRVAVGVGATVVRITERAFVFVLETEIGAASEQFAVLL